MAPIHKSDDSHHEDHHDTKSTVTGQGHKNENATPVLDTKHYTIGTNHTNLSDAKNYVTSENKAESYPKRSISIHTNEIHVEHVDHKTYTPKGHDSN